MRSRNATRQLHPGTRGCTSFVRGALSVGRWALGYRISTPNAGARKAGDRLTLHPGVWNMCGITGYIGKRSAVPVVVDQLRRLEYRGYDSAGVAVLQEGISVIKTEGKIRALELMVDGAFPDARAAVAH